MLSAKRIPFCSILVAIIIASCVVTPLYSEDTGDEEPDLGISRDVPQNVLEEVKTMVEGFLPPTEQDIKTAEAIKDRTDTVTADALGLSPSELKQEKAAPQTPSLCASKVYYLISLSMPSDTVSNIVEEAVRTNKACGKKVVLVGIRGFVGGSMFNTLKKLYKVLTAVKKSLPVAILSKEFKAYDVKEVPFIIVRTKEGEKTVMGDMSIQYAVEKAEDGEITGMTYTSIIEDDFYDMIASKAAAAEARMRKKQYSYDFDLTRYDGHFQKAGADNVFYIEPSYTLDNDIKDANGAVIIKKGTIVRPSDYTPLGRYVFINGNDEKEVQYAISLKPKQIILVSGNPVKLSKKYGMPFYVADDSLVYGLSLTKTPSIIEQDGRLIRVTEKKL